MSGCRCYYCNASMQKEHRLNIIDRMEVKDMEDQRVSLWGERMAQEIGCSRCGGMLFTDIPVEYLPVCDGCMENLKEEIEDQIITYAYSTSVGPPTTLTSGRRLDP